MATKHRSGKQGKKIKKGKGKKLSAATKAKISRKLKARWKKMSAAKRKAVVARLHRGAKLKRPWKKKDYGRKAKARLARMRARRHRGTSGGAKCGYCGQSAGSGSRCQNCGARKCAYCGSPNSGGAKCGNCGAPYTGAPAARPARPDPFVRRMAAIDVT